MTKSTSAHRGHHSLQMAIRCKIECQETRGHACTSAVRCASSFLVRFAAPGESSLLRCACHVAKVARSAAAAISSAAATTSCACKDCQRPSTMLNQGQSIWQPWFQIISPFHAAVLGLLRKSWQEYHTLPPSNCRDAVSLQKSKSYATENSGWRCHWAVPWPIVQCLPGQGGT